MCFKVKDWVLCQVFLNTKDKVVGKLAPKWEGLYKGISIPKWGAYNLEDVEERQLQRS